MSEKKSPNLQTVTVYGTDWCLKSANLKNALQTAWVDFNFTNVETDEAAAEEIKAQYDGQLKFPVVKVGSTYHKNPKWQQLRKILDEAGLLD